MTKMVSNSDEDDVDKHEVPPDNDDVSLDNEEVLFDNDGALPSLYEFSFLSNCPRCLSYSASICLSYSVEHLPFLFRRIVLPFLFRRASTFLIPQQCLSYSAAEIREIAIDPKLGFRGRLQERQNRATPNQISSYSYS
jgi:hypothetical protein